jgi:hypothetical protein
MGSQGRHLQGNLCLFKGVVEVVLGVVLADTATMRGRGA